MATKVYDTLIVGAGFTGIGTAIKLTQAGVDDFVIVEREDRVGGTWRDNTYPGAACDVPSLLYSFSFVKNPNWSRAYSPAGEICEHIEDMVDAFDLRRRIQFGVEVNRSRLRRRRGRVDAQPRCSASDSGPAPSCCPPVRCPTTSGRTSAVSTPTGPQDPQRALGSRLRLHRKTGRGHRYRRQRRADHPRTGQAGRLRQGLPAHARLGAAPAGRLDACRGAGALRESACHPRACPPGAVLGSRGHRDRHGVEHPAHLAGRPAGQGAHPVAGEGSVAATAAHPGLHSRLQTNADLQRLLPRAAARQLQADRLADRHDEPGRDPHQRRCRAPSGLHRVRHRVRRAPDRTAVPDHRARRTDTATRSGPAARRRTRASTPTATPTCSS